MERILFINAVDKFSSLETRYQNIGIGYLISSIRKEFGASAFEFRVISDNLQDAINEFKPRMLCLTSVTQNFGIADQLAQLAKTTGLPTIIGGIHITTLPDSLAFSMDIGCIGEGEETIVEIIKAYENNNWNLPSNSELSSIKGIVYHDEGKLGITEPRLLKKNIDSIPIPSRDFFKIEKSTYILTSRGCPYRCSFCASAVFWDRVRFFSAEYVVEEIKQIYDQYHVDWIHLYDDLFIANKKRMKLIINLLGKEQLLGKIKFSTMGRANLIDKEMAILMKELNIKSVGMGLESGNNEILRYLKGSNVTVEKNVEAVKILKNYGITVFASFVIGSPYETKEQVIETYKLAKYKKLPFIDINILTPYPGTEVWKYAEKRELVKNDMDWELLSANFSKQSHRSIILSEVLSREELLKLYRKFLRLRLFRKYRYFYKHPFVENLPLYILKTILNYFSKVTHKLRKH